MAPLYLLRMPVEKAKAKSRSSETERRRALRRDDREREILVAAATVLDRDPHARIEDIAAEAGVSRQLVALYFPGGGIKAIVDRLVETTVPVLAQALEAMEGAASIFDVDDEIEFRREIAFGLERYLKHSIERAPTFILGNSRELGGSSIEKEIEWIYNAAFDMILSGNSRWGSSKPARVLFVIQCRAVELIGYNYRIGRLTREECLQAMVESWVAFRFSVLPSLG